MSPKEELAASRKEQILDAAVLLFGEYGFYKTTTAHVAREVGVTQPYVFHFFRSKEELYLAVLQRAVEKITYAFQQVEAPSEKLAEVMGAAFEALLKTHRNEILLAMQSFTTPEKAIREQVRQLFASIYKQVKNRFEQAGMKDAASQTSLFISTGLIITMSEVLELPELKPWC